jgi:hypothetical protein
MRSPFTLFRQVNKSGPVWYARFWDGSRYSRARSLDIPVEGVRQRRKEAEAKAAAMAEELRGEPIKIAVPAPLDRSLLLTYLLEFWTAESEYVREQASVNKTPLSAAYVSNSRRNIELHAAPYPPFAGLRLAGLTRKNAQGI